VYRAFLMAMVSVKDSLTREEQDKLSEKLAVMGVKMSWNGKFSTCHGRLLRRC
jgi:hypothetical protein